MRLAPKPVIKTSLAFARIDACTLGHQHGFRRAQHVDDGADLIAGFGHLSGAVRANVDNRLAVTFENVPDASKRPTRRRPP